MVFFGGARAHSGTSSLRLTGPGGDRVKRRRRRRRPKKSTGERARDRPRAVGQRALVRRKGASGVQCDGCLRGVGWGFGMRRRGAGVSKRERKGQSSPPSCRAQIGKNPSDSRHERRHKAARSVRMLKLRPGRPFSGARPSRAGEKGGVPGHGGERRRRRREGASLPRTRPPRIARHSPGRVRRGRAVAFGGPADQVVADCPGPWHTGGFGGCAGGLKNDARRQRRSRSGFFAHANEMGGPGTGARARGGVGRMRRALLE